MTIADDAARGPFSLPLTRGQFAAALRTGHGRALLHVRQPGAAGAEDLILEACLHNQAFDPQCECGRGPWLLEIIAAAGLEPLISDRLAAALADPGNLRGHDVDQLCALNLAFAQHRHSGARAALYVAFARSLASGALVGADEIIALDGADGLRFVAEHLGEHLAASPETESEDDPLLCYDEQHGKGSAEQVLAAAAADHPHIAAYLARVRAWRERVAADQVVWQRRQEEVRSRSAEQMFEEIENCSSGPGNVDSLCARWGRHAPERELRKIAERLFRESDPLRLVRLLRVFQHRPLPDFDVRLLGFANHPGSDVRWWAMRVLAQHRQPAVRALALERLRAGRHDQRALELFRNNYQPGDWTLIRDGIRWPDDQNHVHWILSDLLGICEANAVEEPREPLVLVYERSPCANCRRQAVKILCARRHAPAWLLDECRCDGDPETRRLAAGSAAVQ